MPKHLISVRGNTHSEKEIIGQAGRREREEEMEGASLLLIKAVEDEEEKQGWRKRRLEVSRVKCQVVQDQGQPPSILYIDRERCYFVILYPHYPFHPQFSLSFCFPTFSIDDLK